MILRQPAMFNIKREAHGKNCIELCLKIKSLK
nr:MAG TPA: hypothetical protein [Caudoviricetes sp.]